MKKQCVGLAAILLLIPAILRAEITLGEGVTVVFASVEEGKQLLSDRDDFVQRMSPFDRAARLRTDKDISEQEYLKFVGRNVLAWNYAEKQNVSIAFQGIQAELKALSLPFPKKVYLVKTTGKEEGGAAYTRANAIVFPLAELSVPTAKNRRTICHELFHILSRSNPDLRDKLYAAIGFQKCEDVVFPPALKSRRITNPDAPRNDHCIRLHVEEKARWAIPILFSIAEKYDVNRGGEFFDYLQFQLLLVDLEKKPATLKPVYDVRNLQFVHPQQVSGFFEQIGKNTEYIIHPEEILAENFAHLVLRELNLPSPEIVEKMEAILKEKRIAEPRAPAGADRPRR